MTELTRRAATMCALIGACLGSCADAEQTRRTQLVLVADTDVTELDEARFEVSPPKGEPRTRDAAIAPGRPAVLVMEKDSAGASLGPYLVVVRGFDGSRVLVERRAKVSFVQGETRVASLHLVRACTSPRCPGDLVCSAEGCRPETLSPQDLTEWKGMPPKLSDDAAVDGGRTDADGGSGGTSNGTGSDGGGSTGNSSGGSSGGTTGAPSCSDTTPECMGDSLIVCSGGKVASTKPCPSPGACQRGTCEPGTGCVAVAAGDGDDCGSGLTCASGVCGGGQACTGSCSPTCDPGVAACQLNCGRSNCSPTCPDAPDCEIRCGSSSNCSSHCEGDCDVDCSSSSNCDVVCEKACTVSCGTSSNCKDIQCQPGASCIVHCQSSNNCGISQCAGGTTSCPGNIIVCGTRCP